MLQLGQICDTFKNCKPYSILTIPFQIPPLPFSGEEIFNKPAVGTCVGLAIKVVLHFASSREGLEACGTFSGQDTLSFHLSVFVGWLFCQLSIQGQNRSLLTQNYIYTKPSLLGTS